ncbi:MAG: DUF2723 domain-containing protein [candidate division Zixibacteria bacterium]|nr:DUF2723 domain-containing protein [candidate division Zixibacteria bacterium]
MQTSKTDFKSGFDKTNACIAAAVFLFTFIVYRMTVAPTLSFWDCGEFIACAYILGIPHPPGSPLFILLGRIFSVIPTAADICLRINLISVVSSAGTAMFGYLAVVRMISFWYRDSVQTGWKRVIAYIGGIVGSLFMAFATTNWANAVEAEVYGLAMMLMTIIFWLMLKYFDTVDVARSRKIIIGACYIGMLGVGLHLTTFLIMPLAAVFFVLKKDAPSKAWIAICSFFVIELLLIIIFSNGRGGFPAFLVVTGLMLAVTGYLVYRHINWAVLIAIGAFSMIMVEFLPFVYGLIVGIIAMIILGAVQKHSDWKTGLIILMLAIIGYSIHAFVPIRSSLKPRIDENFTARNFSSMVDFLDRKQYGRQSMVERMFERRAEWAHQFGRHAHMGFWSYFEKQYGMSRVFGLLFVLGLYGIWFAVGKKVEIGLPFLILLLVASVGLVLYMNFADGYNYNARTGDAYLEVRNRDYFFTPAFIFFGLAIGLGVAAFMESVRAWTEKAKSGSLQKPIMLVCSLLVLLPAFPLANNYFENDRSNDYYPYIYSYNILQSCPENAVLFTSGDNDTFPLWCVQEVYNMRKDVRVVNLSLFNTDWYIYQMREQYDVPIALTDDQIFWEPFEFQGTEIQRPKDPFYDRARKRWAYLVPMPFEGRVVKLQDMMVDEVVLESKLEIPICFTSEPYGESPLKLRELAVAKGLVYNLEKDPHERLIDADEGYRLYKEVFRYDGMADPDIYRDENCTGVLLTMGFNALRIAEEFRRTGQVDKAKDMLSFIIEKYPEFFQSYLMLSNIYREEGNREASDSLLRSLETTLTELYEKNPDNQFYLQDLGMAKHYLGKSEEGLPYLWEAFRMNPNSGYAYRKLMQVLLELQRASDMILASKMHANYKINRSDPLVQQVLGGGYQGDIAPPIAP